MWSRGQISNFEFCCTPKNDVVSITRKRKLETSSQKIDVSADIIFGFLTLLEGVVILDLYCHFKPAKPYVY